MWEIKEVDEHKLESFLNMKNINDFKVLKTIWVSNKGINRYRIIYKN